MSNKEKGLKPLDLFMIGFGAIVGVAWAVASNTWVTNSGGAIPAIIGYLIAIVILVAIAFCYAEMTTAMPVAGGVVVYSYKAFGTFPSFISGWLLALAYVVMIPWESIQIGSVLSVIFPKLKEGVVLYSLAGSDIYLNGLIVGFILSVVIVALNWVGAEAAGKFQTILGVVLIFCAVIVIAACFLKADPANLMPLYKNVGSNNHDTIWGGILTMVVLVPWYMSGFDTIPQGIEDAGGKVSNKVLVVTLVGCITVASVFYCLIILSTCMAMDWQQFGQLPQPAVAVIFRYIGYGSVASNVLYWMAMIGALTGLITTWNAFYIAASRFIMSMGRAHLLPEFFAKINKHGTPYGAGIFCAVASFAGPVIGSGFIGPIGNVGSLGFILGWGMTVFSMIALRRKDPQMERPFKVPGGLPVAWFAGLCCVGMAIASLLPSSPAYMGTLAVYIFLGWLVAGGILYIASAKRRNAVSEEERMTLMFKRRHLAEAETNFSENV